MRRTRKCMSEKRHCPPPPPAKKFIKLRSSANVWLPNKKLVHWNHSMSASLPSVGLFLLSKPPWCQHRDAAQVGLVVFSYEFFGRLLFVVDELKCLNGRTTLERWRAFRRPLKKRKAKSLKFRRGGFQFGGTDKCDRGWNSDRGKYTVMLHIQNFAGETQWAGTETWQTRWIASRRRCQSKYSASRSLGEKPNPKRSGGC